MIEAISTLCVQNSYFHDFAIILAQRECGNLLISAQVIHSNVVIMFFWLQVTWACELDCFQDVTTDESS